MERVPKENRETAKRVTQGKSAQNSVQGDIASRLNNSPHMIAQRKKLQSLFGGAAQLKGAEDETLQGKFETAQRAGEEELLQKKHALGEEEFLPGKFGAQQHKSAEEEPLQGKFDAVQRVAEEEPIQHKLTTAQRATEEEPLQGKFDAAQRVEEEPIQHKLASDTPAQLAPAAKPNKTGLPDNLKSGIENLSGMSMDNVKVHYNSSQPAQLNALAYAQGTDIHVAPGQEQHLPHEAWHVVQQAQGRVQPTMQMKGGVPVNDDKGLEHEADVMGGKATQMMEEAHNARFPPSLDSAAIQKKSRTSEAGIEQSTEKALEVIELDTGSKVMRRQEAVANDSSAKPAQLFQNDILLALELSHEVLPSEPMYGFINMKINALILAVQGFNKYEVEHLDIAMYLRTAHSRDAYQNSLPYLNNIYQSAKSIIGMIDKDEKYNAVKPIIQRIMNCALHDYQDYDKKAKAAQQEVSNVFNMIYKQGIYSNPYAQYPQDYITANNFKLANNAGLLHLQMVKWWTSKGFPGFNAEIAVYIGGNFWAIAHLKWNPNTGPHGMNDPYMYNFKTPNNESFQGEFSKIEDSSVQTYLLGTCYHYVGLTATPWQYNETQRFV